MDQREETSLHHNGPFMKRRQESRRDLHIHLFLQKFSGFMITSKENSTRPDTTSTRLELSPVCRSLTATNI